MTQKFRFLPGIDTAPGPNRVRLSDDARPPIVFQGAPDRVTWNQTRRGLESGQRIAGDLARLALRPEQLPRRPAEGPAHEAWRSLREDTNAWLAEHLKAMDLPNYNPKRFLTAEESTEHVLRAGQEGIATVLAFQSVVPRVLFRHEFADPNADIQRWTDNSLGFAMEWMGLHDQVDPHLAYALASPKPRTVQTVFEDLQFDPNRFVAYDDTQRVGLDPLQAPNLRDQTHMRTPQSRQPENVALFGCPARKIIPHIYRTIASQAAERNLFAATYFAERANFGYDELPQPPEEEVMYLVPCVGGLAASHSIAEA